jgi:hypothetical protein
VGQLFLQAANDLTTVLEGVGMLDTKLEEHGGDRHWKFILTLRAGGAKDQIWSRERAGMLKRRREMCSE